MKTGEVKAMGLYNHLRTLVKFFRFTEIFVAMTFLFWIFSRLPLVLRVSSGYISQISSFFTSPVFGFVLCNTIVVALISKPHRFSGDNVDTEILNELVKNTPVRSLSLPESEQIGWLCSDPEPEEIAYEDKEVICEVSSVATMDFTENIDDFGSGSEKLKLEWMEFRGEKFRRPETEEEEAIWGGRVSPECVRYGEELSNREFQRRIEEFIARELRSRREESGAVVLRSGSCLGG